MCGAATLLVAFRTLQAPQLRSLDPGEPSGYPASLFGRLLAGDEEVLYLRQSGRRHCGGHR